MPKCLCIGNSTRLFIQLKVLRQTLVMYRWLFKLWNVNELNGFIFLSSMGLYYLKRHGILWQHCMTNERKRRRIDWSGRTNKGKGCRQETKWYKKTSKENRRHTNVFAADNKKTKEKVIEKKMKHTSQETGETWLLLQQISKRDNNHIRQHMYT